MSARITLHCNTEWRYGTCVGQIITDARTVEEAREEAGRQGWRSRSNNRDYCPGCSGTAHVRAGTAIVHLHIDDRRGGQR